MTKHEIGNKWNSIVVSRARANYTRTSRRLIYKARDKTKASYLINAREPPFAFDFAYVKANKRLSYRLEISLICENVEGKGDERISSRLYSDPRSFIERGNYTRVYPLFFYIVKLESFKHWLLNIQRGVFPLG